MEAVLFVSLETSIVSFFYLSVICSGSLRKHFKLEHLIGKVFLLNLNKSPLLGLVIGLTNNMSFIYQAMPQCTILILISTFILLHTVHFQIVA